MNMPINILLMSVIAYFLIIIGFKLGCYVSQKTSLGKKICLFISNSLALTTTKRIAFFCITIYIIVALLLGYMAGAKISVFLNPAITGFIAAFYTKLAKKAGIDNGGAGKSM